MSFFGKIKVPSGSVCRSFSKVAKCTDNSTVLLLDQLKNGISRNQQVRTMMWRPWWWDDHRFDRGGFSKRFRDMDRYFDSLFEPERMLRPWQAYPTAEEWFNVRHPIVEEHGVKKFKLAFDMRRFSPEEVEIKTKDNKVEINARHESKDGDNSKKFDFHQSFVVPAGVNAEEVTCKYLSDGSLVLEAPYTEQVPQKPPPLPKEQEIKVKHE